MFYSRTLCYEPLEDRRLLALVTVNTLSDTIDLNDGQTSLREAIFATNLVSGADRIDFAPSLTASGPATISLAQGELRITDDLNVDGPGANLLTLDATGNDPTPDENTGDGSRIFHVDDGSLGTLKDVFISGLTLTGGDVGGRGGAILSSENLAVLESRLIGNAAVADDALTVSHGGAIAQLGGNLTVSDTAIVNNSGDFGGGIYFEGGSLVVTLGVIAENSGLSGAGIYHTGSAGEIRASSIRGNSAGAFSLGGGVYNSGRLRIEATTISGNSADYGGGIFSRTDSSNMESTLIVNSTISGNTAFSRGGGVRNAYGQTRIEFSTITGNTAPRGQGSGVASRGYTSSTTRVTHSIIAGNTGSDVDFATGTANTFDSRGYNLIGTGSAVGAFSDDGDRVGIANPLLGPLSDNGGPPLPGGNKLFTHALLPGSPAINAGDLNAKAGVDGVPLFDQRGEPFSRVVKGRIDIGAFEYQVASDLNLLVDTLGDESDGNHGRGDLSLREAIELANFYLSHDTIRFDPTLTAAGAATILLTKGELRITDDVSIEGPGAHLLTIDASGNDPTPTINDGRGTRIYMINRLVDVSLYGQTLTGGDSTSRGGAIFSRAADVLSLRDTVISGNATRESGGAIYASNARVVIESTTVSNNIATAQLDVGRGGGGIFIRSANVTIRESTISGNSAPIGGGIYFRSYGQQPEQQIVLVKTTISGNHAFDDGGGIWARVSGSSITLTDSLLEDNIAGLLSMFGGSGGAVYADLRNAAATISGSVIRDNSALGGGGAHFTLTDGSVFISDSNIANNHAFTGSGGGLAIAGNFSSTANIATIRNSTINGNSSSLGGGISAGRIPLTVDSSTISGNLSTTFGGGISQGDAALYLLNATITGNIVRQLFGGGGIHASGSSGLHVSVSHSIVAGNFASLSNPQDIWLQSVAPNLIARHSLIGHNTGSGLTETPPGLPDANGNLIGGPVHGAIDPRLAPLADNGGPTMTHALLPGSPAINAGDPAARAGEGGVPQFDQRGAPFTRVHGGQIDIGAFEAQPNPLSGDYNYSGVVDTADVIVWRKTLGSTTDLRADGNGDGIVNDADWQVWRANFGRTAASEEPPASGYPAESGGPEAVESLPQRPAWQPPASQGVSATPSRPVFRPPIRRFDSADELLAALASPRATSHGKSNVIPERPQLMRDADFGLVDPTIDAVDQVFETLGVM